MSQWFAPTKLVVSFEIEGQGRFTNEEIEKLVEKDASGRVLALHLPQKAVMIANHQVDSSISLLLSRQFHADLFSVA